jgi:Cof subfamily protein (haloacid dehalogenase superfamily)
MSSSPDTFTPLRALCTDIDGTLLDKKRELSEETIRIIRQLQERMPIILASSRMPSAMYHLQRQLGILHYPLICYNGGYVIHRVNETDSPSVLHSVQIPASLCTAILNVVKQTSAHASLYVDDLWFAPRMDEWTIREATITKVDPILKPGDDVLAEWIGKNIGAHKVMCMGVADEISFIESTLRKNFADRIHIYHSKDTYLELAPKSISKATALKLLLARIYNLDLSDAIAFGDNYNDVEMIQSVGLGVAVDNARSEVKAVAKAVTANSKEDGVAQAIKKYLMNS